jgi:GABA(A) receptor-associated protein|tara:strand:- start:605 stop:1012 length:408 start_codon:yes stop_codon:yes gene_type:complete
MNNIIKNVRNYYDRKQEMKSLEQNYKSQCSFEKRLDESTKITEKYPQRVPVICERMSIDIPEIDRKKFLCPDDLSLANFMYVIRKRLKLAPEKSIYLFINGKLVNNSKLLIQIYEENKDEDGFLYIQYASESTFG